MPRIRSVGSREIEPRRLNAPTPSDTEFDTSSPASRAPLYSWSVPSVGVQDISTESVLSGRASRLLNNATVQRCMRKKLRRFRNFRLHPRTKMREEKRMQMRYALLRTLKPDTSCLSFISITQQLCTLRCKILERDQRLSRSFSTSENSD